MSGAVACAGDEVVGFGDWDGVGADREKLGSEDQEAGCGKGLHFAKC